jgi:chromate transport protein ChrA
VKVGAWLWIALGSFLLLPFIFGAGAEVAETDFDALIIAGVPSLAIVCSVLALVALRKQSRAAWGWAWATAAVTCLFCVGFVHLFILFVVDGDALGSWLIDEQERRLGGETAA